MGMIFMVRRSSQKNLAGEVIIKCQQGHLANLSGSHHKHHLYQIALNNSIIYPSKQGCLLIILTKAALYGDFSFLFFL